MTGRPLRRDPVTLLGALVVIPALLGVLGGEVIFDVFGDGDRIAPDTLGDTVIDFWDGGGLALVSGIVVFGFVLVRRRSLAAALLLGFAGAALAFVYAFTFFLVWLLLNPGALN